MDLQNLYPDYGSPIYCGFESNQFSCKLTNTLSNFTASETMADSYFLGYVIPSSVPTFYKFSVIYNELATSNKIIISEGTPATNFMVGYCFRTIDNDRAYCFKDNNGNIQSYGLQNVCLPNDFYPEFFGLTNYNNNTVALRFRMIVYTLNTTSYNIITADFALSYSDFVAFMQGSLKLSYKSGSTTIFQFTSTDLNEYDTGYIEPGNDKGYRFWLAGYHLISSYSYNGTPSYSTSNKLPYSFVKVSTNHKNGETTTGYRFGTGNYGTSGFYFLRWNINTNEFIEIPSHLRSYGIAGYEYTPDDFPFAGIYYTFPHVVERTGNWVQFMNKYPLSDVEKMINLQCRITISNQPSYYSGFTYAVDVNSNNQFMDEIKTGNLSDENFKNSLRRWQYVDIEEWEEDPTKPQGITNNEFVEEDAPPYDPTPPTPEGEEGHNPDNPDLNLGITEDVPGDSVEPAEYRDTSITFPISAFLTQYVLTAQDIFDMGHSLWSGIGDPNSSMAANFVKTYTSTGTLNISNVIDFFVSVKVFPFDIADFNIITLKPAMTIGTGAVPLLNYTVPVLNVATYVLDCGTVNTLQAGAFRLSTSDYDFRNYINCTYTVFLPFCGNIELNPADVFPYELSCKYFIDFISGSCTGCVYVLRDNKEVLVGSKTGQIGKIVPITASNVNAVVGAALSDVSNLMQTIGGAVISAATNRALGASQMPVNEASKSADYLKKLNDYRAEQNAIRTQGNESQGYLGMATKSVSDVGNMMSRSGINIPSLSGGTGLDALHISKRPYLAIRRLNYCSPNQYAHTTGFAGTDGSSSKPLGRYQGWTVLENPDLSNIKATQEELSEIKYLLETGVYV